MVSEMPGTGAGKRGAGDHSYQEKIEPKQQEMMAFAKRIADSLDVARKGNKLAKLLLIAAPEFLGELKNNFSNETREKVSFELDENLAHHSVEDIRKHLP